MAELTVPASAKAREFVEEIVEQMLLLFPITREEAIGRINETWRHVSYLSDTDVIFHETAVHWAKTIYYGKESMWWLGEEGLPPRPYPAPPH